MKKKLSTLAAALLIIGYALLLWRGPWWLDGAHLRDKNLQPADGVVITGFRTALVALGAGAIATLGLYYSHRAQKNSEATLAHTQEKDREQITATREGQVTDRYVEAIKLLSSEIAMQQLGGVYSLERIMRDSEKDHQTVVEVLSAFVRVKTREPSFEIPDSSGEAVQAALDVLGRRPERPEPDRMNLRGVNLVGANLSGVRFSKADLSNSILDGANLTCADLTEIQAREVSIQSANLSKARLERAHLERSNLSNSDMTRVNLRDAYLLWATLENADLSDADLTNCQLNSASIQGTSATDAKLANTNWFMTKTEGAMLYGSDLSGETRITSQQVLAAKINKQTTLPDMLEDLPEINQHMSWCERELEEQ
jgi:hypothetical protein